MNRSEVSLFGLCLSVSLGIAVPAAFAAVPAHRQPTWTFERVFTTPEERERLNLLRDQKRLQGVATEQLTEPATTETPPRLLTVNGVVRRKNRRAVVWVNQSSARAGETIAGAGKVSPHSGTHRVTLQVPDQRWPVSLKPGQSIDLQKTTIYDAFDRKPDVTPDADPTAAVGLPQETNVTSDNRQDMNENPIAPGP